MQTFHSVQPATRRETLRWHQKLNPLYLLILILERLYQMPTLADFAATVASFKTFLSNSFDALDVAIKADIDAAIASLPAGVPQEVIDTFTDLQNTVSARIATSESAAAAEVPVAAPPAQAPGDPSAPVS